MPIILQINPTKVESAEILSSDEVEELALLAGGSKASWEDGKGLEETGEKFS
jgi:hypothetical protein